MVTIGSTQIPALIDSVASVSLISDHVSLLLSSRQFSRIPIGLSTKFLMMRLVLFLLISIWVLTAFPSHFRLWEELTPLSFSVGTFSSSTRPEWIWLLDISPLVPCPFSMTAVMAEKVVVPAWSEMILPVSLISYSISPLPSNFAGVLEPDIDSPVVVVCSLSSVDEGIIPVRVANPTCTPSVSWYAGRRVPLSPWPP